MVRGRSSAIGPPPLGSTGIEAPKYPLSRAEFRRALATGHGRARIHVERFGAEEFRDEILDAATFNQVCDPQVNGSRGEWLAEICILADLAGTIVTQPFPEEHRDRTQRVELLLAFARRGIAGAREALYACLRRAPGTSDVYASREIIELDGEAGLLFVVRAMGALLGASDDFRVWGYELSVFDEQHGPGSGRARLEREAAADVRVRVYLDHVELHEAALEQARRQQAGSEDESGPARALPPRMSVQRALRLIATSEPGEPRSGLGHWGQHAQPEELQQVLALLLESSNPRVLESALRALGGSHRPPLHARILELACHPDADVRRWAGHLLSRHSRLDIRELGLETLARGDAEAGIEILRRSARAEDAEALLSALVSLRNAEPGRLHGAGSSALELLEECPGVAHAAIALELYEWNPCAHCRGRALELLLELEACPRWVLDECAQDGWEWIRELAAKGLPPPASPR